MRKLTLMLAGAMIASCTTAPPLPTRSANGQIQYQRMIAGKVAGAPVRCLSNSNANDMTIIDEQTIAYRLGGQVYINHLQRSCPGLGGPSNALVTRSSVASEICRGDVAYLMDTGSHFTVGSCVFGDFIPYAAPRSH